MHTLYEYLLSSSWSTSPLYPLRLTHDGKIAFFVKSQNVSFDKYFQVTDLTFYTQLVLFQLEYARPAALARFARFARKG